MTRTQTEEFKQDRLGNVNRTLDEIRSQEGMSMGDGIVQVTAGTPAVVYETPSDAQGVHLNEIHAHNASDAEATFTISEAPLDDNGNPMMGEATQRTVRYNVGAGVTRTIPYSGIEIDDDAIVVESTFNGDIGVGMFVDRKEEYEPATEQTETPS